MEEQVKTEVYFLIVYPTILIVCWVFLVWMDFSSAFLGSQQSKWLNQIRLTAFLDGFLNAVAFCTQIYKRKKQMDYHQIEEDISDEYNINNENSNESDEDNK